MNQLRSSINEIKTLHAQSLNSTSGPPAELGQLVDETRQMSQNLKQAIKRVNSSTGGDKGKKQQVKGVKEQFVGLLGEYQVSPCSARQVHGLAWEVSKRAAIRHVRSRELRGSGAGRPEAVVAVRIGPTVDANVCIDHPLPSVPQQNIEKTHRSKVKQRAERQFKIGQSASSHG